MEGLYRVISGCMEKLLLAALEGAAFARMMGQPDPGLLSGQKYIESVFTEWEDQVMPSVGEVAFPVFMVEFQDVKYSDKKVSEEILDEWVFTGADSVAGYYDVSSGGLLKMEGDVYLYTAEGSIGDYESPEGLEDLIMEIFNHYDDEVDFSRYDRNGDSYMDAVIVSVPRGGDESFWWAATHSWYFNWEYQIDGLYVLKYIVNDEQPYITSRGYFTGTLEHELGHCMGLSDYYKYNYEGSDYEGLHGFAGKERMDDSEGDFCQFSKLQLGWLTKEQVQIMPENAQSQIFYLPPVCEGGCLLIFPKGQEPDFQGEYFCVEYNTPEGLWKETIKRGGVRVLHVQAEIIEDQYGYRYYKYDNYSPYYDSTNQGIRILKLVNDGKGFYEEGSTVTFENTGGEKGNFGWYTEAGGIAAPGFRIRIGEVQDNGFIEVEVIWE